MSFLNPVNEPVLRFSSTDAGAPQINYNSRTAGDVKAVLKACLVTGYGSTASAGWSIVNEVNHVAEFVSPSAAMSDYRLGIDDANTSSTTWYYQYKNVRTNPRNNSASKNFSAQNKTHSSNGWQLFVTNRGLYFVEVIYIDVISDVVCRITFMGAVKSTMVVEPDPNFGFWILGANAAISQNFFSATDVNSKDYSVGSISKSDVAFAGANVPMLARTSSVTNNSTIGLTAELFLQAKGQLIAQQAGILLQDSLVGSTPYGIKNIDFNSRPACYVCIGYDSTNLALLRAWSHGLLIYTDYWEY